jgi:hypothetical protein
MKRLNPAVGTLASSLLLFLTEAATAGDWGIDVFGASYHLEQARAKERRVDNQFNPGLGLRYRASHSENLDWVFDVGGYHDSGRNTALFAGAGLAWHATERLRLGGALAAFQSKTYNGGKAAIAPVPVAAYEWRSVSLNVVYFPRLARFNDINTFGFWITIWDCANGC